MNNVRRTAVAGQFYPGEAKELEASVSRYLQDAASRYLQAAQPSEDPAPKAIIAPHAGYLYSGPIAGTAYAQLARANGAVRQVVLLGPAHYVHVRGLGVSSADAFDSPLGRVRLSSTARERLLDLPQVNVSDQAHRPEHSLEVQLPFLQTVFSDFELVPLVVGFAEPDSVAEVLDLVWGGPETVIVVSSDLSHFHDYHTAVRLDQVTAEAIETLRPLSEAQACGGKAINGLLKLASQKGLQARTLDLRNSGDTAGPRDQVVGYGAFAFWKGDRQGQEKEAPGG